MINICRSALLTIIFLALITPITAHAASKGTMYLLFVDLDNTISLQHYLHDIKKRIKSRDMLVFFDAQTSEVIREYSHITSRDRAELRTSLDSDILNSLDALGKYKSGEYNYSARVNIKQLKGYDRDVARMIATAEEYIRIYKDSFAETSIVFFGDSILHDAYYHEFSEGIPADGFIYSPDSEFNSFPDIKGENVSVRIFYDEEPVFSKGLLRFYDKLIKKKLGVALAAYNSNVAMNSVPDAEGVSKEFFPNEVRVISEKVDSECGTPDKLLPPQFSLETAKVTLGVVNKCRAGTEFTYQLVHSNEKRQVTVDANGRTEETFRLSEGLNKIRYKSLTGDWVILFEENIEPRPDDIIFQLDETTNTVLINGKNPFRLDDDHVDIEYENTGSHYNLDVHDGKFSKEVPVVPGKKNIFLVKSLNGKEVTKHVIEYSTKCSDVVEPNLEKAREDGILSVYLKNTCRKDGSKAKFFYDGKERTVVMQGGVGSLNIILNHEVNDVFYEDYNKNTSKVATIKIRDFSDLIHFEISFKDNVAVVSNVFETNIPDSDPHESVDYDGSAGKPFVVRDGHLHVSNQQSKRGKFLKFELFKFPGYLSEFIFQTTRQIYTSRQSKQGKGNMYFFVDYYSRHGSVTDEKGKIEGPLCGARSRGGVVLDYTILFNGTMEKGKKFIDPAKCENGKPTKADNKLVLIKKVSIQ